MNLELERVALSDQPILERLLQLHLYTIGMEPGPDGLIDFGESLDDYLCAPGYGSLFFKLDGEIAGFALLRLNRKPAGPDGKTPVETNVVEKFHVMRPFRRKGIGTQAMDLIRRDFSGRWTITSWPDDDNPNPGRVAFWRRVAAGYGANGREFGPKEHHGYVGQYVWVIDPDEQELQ